MLQSDIHSISESEVQVLKGIVWTLNLKLKEKKIE